MAGIADLSQLFRDCGSSQTTKSNVRTKKCFVVPEPPVSTDIPDLDTLFGGDGGNSLLDLQPWPYLPSQQTTDEPKKQQNNDYDRKPPESQVFNNRARVSERGDCDDVYLGSQFPLIHNIGPSQVPKSYLNSQSSQRVKAQQSQGYQGYGTTHSTVKPATQQRTNRDFHVPRRTASQNTGDQSVFQPDNRIHSGRPGSSIQPSTHYSPERDTKNNSQEDLFEESEQHTAAPSSHTTGKENGPKVNRNIPKDVIYTPSFVAVPLDQYKLGVRLKPITEIPENFRRIFNFSHFNIVQSKVFDDVMYTDKSLVLCSPTGSGKTAVFEMAVVRLMTRTDVQFSKKFKVVYMAPIKALCSERYSDWKEKFEPFGLKVMELTGDTDTEEFYELQEVNIVLTTPEKWDSMTRKWRDNKSVMQAICLFLIDEIHVLNDPTRGAVVEAVVSRMKTIQAARQRAGNSTDLPLFRFLAISATITNIEDLAEWLGQGKTAAVHYKFDDSARPVRLRKVVLGYHFAENKQSEFQFDISLSYKLAGVINTYSDDKPTLIFCATRKSSMQGAEIISKDVKGSYVRNAQHRLVLQNHSFHIKDTKLRDLVVTGIGYHHAGMDVQDRRLIEEIFASGELPVLVATSTLAMGVNLPAHLVIIKSTMYYNMGSHQEYPDTQVLQMIGRAGRPQFDTSATAVIMTKNTTKLKYENLLNGSQQIESSLHKNLVEHLNAEIVLNTITDISVAVEWLKYTFLYIRVMKNPAHYGMPNGLTKQSIEKRLQDLCMKGLMQLHRLNLIQMNEENMDVRTTESGRLMARYCISYKTAELFLAFKGDESISDMLSIMCKCEEFSDIKLRTNEKKTLNTLNRDKNRITIRYPMAGKIKTTDMKVSCLIQATFGSLLIQDFALQQDIGRIFRAGIRVTRCLVELLSQKTNFKCLLSAMLLCKCFKAKLWEDSKYVSKQLDGIGPTLSTALVNAGLTNFEKLEEINPREIELITNRHPPFGNQVKEAIAKLPKYELVIEQVMRYSVSTAEIVITLQISNREVLKNCASTGHTCTLLVGDADNKVVYKQRVMDAMLLKETSWSKKLEIRLAEKGPELSVHYISQDWVGLDVECSYTPNYLGSKVITSSGINQQPVENVIPDNKSGNVQPCQHSCHNKLACGHDCCKYGITSKRRNNGQQNTTKPAPVKPMSTKPVANHVMLLKNKSSCLPPTPSLSKRARLMNNSKSYDVDLAKYAYTPNRGNHMYDRQDQLSDSKQPLNDTYQDTVNRFNRQQEHSGGPAQFKQPGRKTGDGWSQLDMYTKYRQNCASGQNGNNEEENTPPNIDSAYMDLANPGPYWNDQYMEDDFAHETDYGLIYISADDQNALLHDLDDQVTDQYQNSSFKGSFKKHGNGKGNRAQTVLLNSNKQQPLTSTTPRQPKRAQPIHKSNNLPGPTCLSQVTDNNQSDYDIEDYSNESFEAAANTEQVSSNRRHNLDHAKMKQFDYEDCDYNLDTTGAVYRPASICDASSATGEIVNKKDENNNIYKVRYYPEPNFQGQRGNRKNMYGIEGTGNNLNPTFQDVENNSFYRVNESIQAGAGNNSLYVGQMGGVDNVDLDVYEDVCCREEDTNPSKWTNYFSSQSSTASDNLNWRYPTRGKDNTVVMQDRTTVQDQCSQQVMKPNKTAASNDRMSSYPSDRDGSKVHKYGQVLAWVSDPENHQFCGQGGTRTNIAPASTDPELSKSIDKSCIKTAFDSSGKANKRQTFFSMTKSPEKSQSFAEIFEGIL